ncbi:MAG: tetratricopeptide repeat protein [Myxococcales bacterium]|nr:tetratricopeptide repeat protein [Myxococcales bacterium]
MLAPCLAMIGGCHYTTLHQGSELQAELTTVTTEDLFLLGVSHARSGDLLRAEQYLTAARQRGHDEASAIYWLVRVCVAASRYQSALGHAAQYLRDHPAHWPLRLVVASIYEALGDLARAESELEQIVRAAPDRALPHYRLAMLYRNREDDRGRSRSHLEAYLKLMPRGPHAAEAESVLSEVSETEMGPQRTSYPVDASQALKGAP